MRTYTTAQKLEKWADIVKKAPANRFNMKAWKCGTNYCAAGFLAASRFGHNLGLSFDGGTLIFDGKFGEYALAAVLDVPGEVLGPIVYGERLTKRQVVAKIRLLARFYK